MKLTTGSTSLIPEGEVLAARLMNVEPNTFEWGGETVHKLRWKFVVAEEGDWQGREITGDTSTNFIAHPNCKAYNWTTAITGRTYGEGEELETDDLVGMPCKIIIMHKAGKEGATFMNVKDVLPHRGAASVPPSEAPF